MTIYAVHDTTTGDLVSVRTIIADPLPDTLTAVALDAHDAAAVTSGSGRWDPTTRTIVPAPPPSPPADVAAAATEAIEALTAEGSNADPTVVAALTPVLEALARL